MYRISDLKEDLSIRWSEWRFWAYHAPVRLRIWWKDHTWDPKRATIEELRMMAQLELQCKDTISYLHNGRERS